MDIEIVKPDKVSIFDVKPSKTFEYNSIIYMKIKTENNCDAVNVDTGEIITVNGNDKVKPLNSKLFIYVQ